MAAIFCRSKDDPAMMLNGAVVRGFPAGVGGTL
jgi:hypothetical protein